MHTVHSGCKINLFLDITGAKGDYHTLFTLFLPLSTPNDTLHIVPGTQAGLSVQFHQKNTEAHPAIRINPASNTLTKAYAHYKEATGFAPQLQVHVEKHVPSGAGLGGGSANAAALLQYLQAIAPMPLAMEELMPIAARVGADVPFFLHKSPCYASGIGDNLYPLSPKETAFLRSFTVLLLCPAFPVSTTWAFKAYDKENYPPRPAHIPTLSAHERLLSAEKNSLKNFAEKGLTSARLIDKSHVSCSGMFFVRNALEPVVFAAHPILGKWKSNLFQHGAAAAGMSGSGSSLFGLFRSSITAKKAACSLREVGKTGHKYKGMLTRKGFRVYIASF